jgi:hypothetical protein
MRESGYTWKWLGGSLSRQGVTVGSKKSLPGREQAKAGSRSYSEVLYEHRVENSRASRGCARKKRRMCPALDAGFFIF